MLPVSRVSNCDDRAMLRLPIRRVFASVLCLTLAARGGAGQSAEATPAHHRGSGFQNNYIEFQTKGLGGFLKWKWDAMRAHVPPAPAVPTPQLAPDLVFIHANAKAGTAMQPAVTWLGHATTLAQLGGLNVLLDPIFSQRASPLSWVGPQRAQAPGLALAQLPHIDAVLVSHNHYDHCDEASLRALNAQAGGPPLFIVPLKLKAWMAGIGILNVTELDWWQGTRLGAVEFVLTPVQHWSGRGLTDRMDTLWGGFALFAPDFHLYFAGDTGYSKDFADIHQRFAARQQGSGFDLALIPVGSYAPRWFMTEQHVNPDEAVRIHNDLHARQSIGVHWGTFELTDEALDAPPRALAAARRKAGVADEAFVVIAIGETRQMPRRASDPAAHLALHSAP